MDNIKKYHTLCTGVGLLFILLFVGALTVLFQLSSCSTQYKVRKTYEKAAAYSPITSKDSNNAFIVARKVVKEKPPRVIPGKTIIKKVPVDRIKKVLDTSLVERIADSLQEAVLSQTENYNNNIDEVIRDCNKALKLAVKSGYKQALDSLLNIQLPNDTIPHDEETLMELSDCQLDLREVQRQVITLTAEKDIYRNQSNKWWLWLIGGLFGGAVLGRFIKFPPLKMSK